MVELELARMPNCFGCRYWETKYPYLDKMRAKDPTQEFDELWRGECRRRAPNQAQDRDRSWPMTYGFDWCGDFEHLITKEPPSEPESPH